MPPSPQALLDEIRAIADEGGWVFLALLCLAFGIAYTLLNLWHALRLPEASLLAPRQWRRLLSRESVLGIAARAGGAGADAAAADESELLAAFDDPDKLAARLAEEGQRLFARSERRFPFAFILISAAPLIGLLGTVSGMFTTFRGMAVRSASAPIDVISEGISQALITTQTGLVIGVPTFILCAWLKSRHDALVIRYRRLESQLVLRAEGREP